MSGLTSRSSTFFVGSRTEIFRAFLASVVPDEGPSAPGAGSDATVRTAEEFVQGQEGGVRAKLGLLLRAFEWGTFFRYGARFSRLPAAAQNAYIRAWQSSPIQSLRFGFSSLRNLALLAFYTQPESWDMIGYPGPQHGSRPSSEAPPEVLCSPPLEDAEGRGR